MGFYAPFKSAEVDPQNCTETSGLLLRQVVPKVAAPDAEPDARRAEGGAEGAAA